MIAFCENHKTYFVLFPFLGVSKHGLNCCHLVQLEALKLQLCSFETKFAILLQYCCSMNTNDGHQMKTELTLLKILKML